MEVDKEDRFYDDKLDILEFETYDAAPMDPMQSFDLNGGAGGDGQPDPAMIQFARLCQLGGTDAFLLESIFRKDVWDFMALPVSEQNELAVVTTLTETCQRALDEFDTIKSAAATTSNDKQEEEEEETVGTSANANVELCLRIRDSETIALEKTMAFLLREKEALDLKEYYQERRLKDLGLDSDWSMEDDYSGGGLLGSGGFDDNGGRPMTRTPGGADFDW